mmetsp:Transcript_16696/g.40943  ORF Transcript_16696/g.40943 Transcript_16696/m.40943 type:complete len:447 (-) Transcript_16696:291-1631(-)
MPFDPKFADPRQYTNQSKEAIAAQAAAEQQQQQEEESGAGGVSWNICTRMERGKRPGDSCCCCALLPFGFFVFMFIFFALAVDEWVTDSRGDKVREYNAAVDAWTTGGKADEYAARWVGVPPPALMVQGAVTNFTVLNDGSRALGVLPDPTLDYKRYRRGSVLSATAASVHTPGADTADVVRVSIGDMLGTFNPPGYLCGVHYTRFGHDKRQFWYARRQFLSSADFVEVNETSGKDTFDGVLESQCAYKYSTMSRGGVDQPMGYYEGDEGRAKRDCANRRPGRHIAVTVTVRSSADPYLTAVALTGHGCSRIGRFGPTQDELASRMKWIGRYAAIPFGLFLLFACRAWCLNARHRKAQHNDMAAEREIRRVPGYCVEPGQVAIPVFDTEEDAARANGEKPTDPTAGGVFSPGHSARPFDPTAGGVFSARPTDPTAGGVFSARPYGH